jgi:hypothetical protein
MHRSMLRSGTRPFVASYHERPRAEDGCGGDMPNYVRRARLPLMRKPARIPDPGEIVDLRMEDASWREGFRAISEPSTAETGEAVIWICTEDEYREAHREERRAVGMWWPVARMRVSPSPQPWRLTYRYG